MTCALTPEKYKNLVVAVVRDLSGKIKNKQSFDMNDYSKDVYNRVLTKTNDHARAITYVMALPSVIITVQSVDKDIRNLIANSYSTIVNLETVFEDFDKTVDYLGVAGENLNTLQQVQNVIDNTPKVEIPKESVFISSPARHHDVLATTGPESTKDEKGKWTNIPDPEKKFYYDVLKSIIDKVTLSNGDSTKLESLGFPSGGIFLTAMSSSRIPENQQYPHIKRFLNVQDKGDENLSEIEKEKELIRRQQLNKTGLALALTDKDGKFIYFNDKLEPTFAEDGKVAYYFARRTNEKGELESPEKLLSVGEMSKYLGIPIDKAQKMRDDQLKELHSIREYINKDPEKNFIKRVITGGSKGYIDIHPSIQTPFSKLVFNDEFPFDPRFQLDESGPFYKSATFFKIPGTNQSILIQRKGFTLDLINKINSILFDNVYIEGKQLTPLDRINYSKIYLESTEQGINTILSSDGNSINIIIKGTKLDISNPKIAKKTISDYLSRFAPLNEVSKPKDLKNIIDGTEPFETWKDKLRQGSIVKTIGDKGKEIYTKWVSAQININRHYLKRIDDFHDISLETIGDKVILTETKKNYKDFLGEHTFINANVNSEGKIVALNGYLTSTPVDSDMEKISSKEEIKPEIPSSKIVESGPADRTTDDLLDQFTKTILQKDLNKEVTEQQIQEAKTWYENHPLNKYFPFKSMFSLINTATPNAVATWTMQGINLYQGADYSDLYHESWHGFTQGFLTKDQKTDLYNELRKKSGSFKTYQGSSKSFNTATNLELEEFLAEDFRSYMLSGGKKLSTPVRNTIFRKILNFLKALFGNTTISQIAADNKSLQTVYELYDKLRVGDLSGYTFSQDNAVFNILSKSLQSITNENPIQSLSYGDSMVLVDTIDSLFSEVIDIKNSQTGSSRFTSSILSTEKNRTVAYKYAQRRMEQLRDDLIRSLEGVTSDIEKSNIQKNIDLLNYGLSEFGDSEKPLGDKTEKGLINYHNLKSEFLKVAPEIEEDLDEAEESSDQYRDKSGNENSVLELAERQSLYLVRGLFDLDKDGTPKKNRLGANKLANFNIVHSRLIKVLQGSSTPQIMEQRLKNEARIFPIFNQLLSKLGSSENTSPLEFKTWSAFWNTYHLPQVELIQLTLDRSGDEYTAKIGRAATHIEQAGRKWDTKFQTDTTNSYIKKDSNGIPFLDIPSVLRDFPVKMNSTQSFNFFKAIGADLSDIEPIRDAINKGTINSTYIRHALQDFLTSKIIIRRTSEIFTTNHGKFNRSEATTWNKLQGLETRHSDFYSNFSVTNAAGDLQHEHSKNSSATKMFTSINDAKSFNELIAQPHMSYLDPEKNLWVNNSLLLNSIFDIKAPGRPKRRVDPTQTGSPFVKIDFQNLSGIQKTLEEEFQGQGVSSAGADEFSKFLFDFHSMIIAGAKEFMRSADKSTSFTGRVSNIIAPGNSGRYLYVDTEQFITNPTRAMRNTHEIMLGYLSGEIQRMKRMSTASELDPVRNVKEYYERGKDFVIFDDILSGTTKNKLKTDLKSIVSLDDYLNQDPNLKVIIQDEIDRYFNEQFQATEKLYNKSKFIANNLTRTIRDNSIKTEYEIPYKTDRESIIQGALKSYTVNNWIHNMESTVLIYGDPAQYNLDKEEFHKRDAMFMSSGDDFRVDDTAIEFVNNSLGFGYAKSIGVAPQNFSSILNTAILADQLETSKYIDIYRSALEKDIRSRYEKNYQNWTDSEGKPVSKDQVEKLIIDEVNGFMKAYENMKIADSQGYITFDAYRALKNLDNSWTDKQEDLYQKIIKKERVSSREVSEFFPIMKLQYTGPLHNPNGLSVMAGHKFSILPLIPSIIKNTHLEDLHNKMVRENVHYALFRSGSKISTITDKGVEDRFYTDDKSKILSDKSFTQNPIYLQYLKDQLYIAPEYKEKTIFSTQLRALIELGLMEFGVPTDYETDKSIDSRRESWNKLSKSEKQKKSNRYSLLIDYENNLNKLTEVKKKQLLKEAGQTLDENGNPIGDLKPLVKFIKKNLSREEIADHTLDFIDITNDNKMKHDLSYALNADKIERLLTSIVNKRLIRQKVNGEGLFQTAGTGWVKEVGEDLSSYRPGKDGKTLAAQCMIALQGNFLKLLNLQEVKDKAFNQSISRLQALNQLIKDEDWLNTGSNRQMITITSVRIPVQGLNSMEFLEIQEFLPKESGNMIVLPAEIVGKSGSDFDGDKLTTMFPNIRVKEGIAEIFKQYDKKEAEKLYEKAKLNKINTNRLRDSNGDIVWSKDEQVDKLMTAMFGNSWNLEYTQEEIDEILKEENMKSFPDFFETLNGSKAIENDLINNIRKILELPENFVGLIKPNSTNLTKPLADRLASKVQDYNPKNKLSGTRLFEIEHNLNKHQTNGVGKQTLGIGAVGNKWNPILNRDGAYINPSYEDKTIKGKDKHREINLFLPHNTLNINGQKAISLSHLYDVENKNNISDILSQLINGWLEVAKDSFVFNLQANKEVVPVLDFMIQAGVPIEHAVYFVSQPLIRKYINEQRLAKSTFADALGKAPSNPNFFRYKARQVILLDPVNNFKPTTFVDPETREIRISNQSIYTLTRDITNAQKETAFAKSNLWNNINKPHVDITQDDKATLLHFIELEELAKSIRNIKLRMNVDTSKSLNLFGAESKTISIEQLEEDPKLPKSLIRNIRDNSPLSSLFIQKFMSQLWSPIFKFRNKKLITEFIHDKFKEKGTLGDVESTFDDPEKFVTEFNNDLVSFIFQNSIKDFDLDTIKNYKNLITESETAVKQVKLLTHGVFVKDKTLYVDKKQIESDFKNNRWKDTDNVKNYNIGYNPKTGLALINPNAFSTLKEYAHFVFEREYQRSILDPEKLKTNIDFISIKNDIITANKSQEVPDLNKIAYEIYLRDKALDNTFNSWKMFESKNSYADKYLDIINAHPQLRENYLIFSLLAYSQTRTYKNLYSLHSKMDKSTLETLHENLLDLSDSSKMKVEDVVENDRISNFFKRFSVYTFLQSGLTIKGSFVLTAFAPNDTYTRIMEKAVGDFTSKLNSGLLNLFYRRFVGLNSVTSRKSRSRHKNWILPESIDKTLSSLNEQLKQQEIIDQGLLPEVKPAVTITLTDKEGIKEFNSPDYKKSDMLNAIATNPEAVFVYSRTLDPKSAGIETTNAIVQESGIGFKVGIPLKLKYMETKPGKIDMYSVNNSITDKTLDENKRLIDVAIQQLLDYKAAGRDIIFDKNGYGQGMIGRNVAGTPIIIKGKQVPIVARQTFVYLSEQLYTNFGYVNNNYTLSKEGKEQIQANQEVSDNDVQEFMKKCLSTL